MARCLYCGKTLWLRLSSQGSEFCGEEHRCQYDELVLARLRADESQPAAPAEAPEFPLETEMPAEAGPGGLAGEQEWVPVMAGFQPTEPVAALAQESRFRLPAGFRGEGIAKRLPEARRRARPVAARVQALPVPPADGVLEARPAVTWKLPPVCLAAQRNAGPSAGAPQMAKLRGFHLARELGAAETSPVLARGEWRWRSVLPVHTGSVIEPVVWDAPRPARLIRLRVGPQAPAPGRHGPSVWSHTAVALPARRIAASAAIVPARPHARWTLPRDTRAPGLDHPCVWSHTAAALPARRIAASAAIVPARPHPVSTPPRDAPAPGFDHPPVWSHRGLATPARNFAVSAAIALAPLHRVVAHPRDYRAGTPRFDRRLRTPPIVLPRLTTHPTGLPVLRREEMDSLVEPESPVAPPSRVARVRSWWRSVPRVFRVAALVLPLLGASMPLAVRIPQAFRSFHWQDSPLARRIESALQQRAVIEVAEDFRSGLSGWEGGPEWSEGWSYDPAGFVHPGRLALLTASRALADYRVEFLGLIERKGIGWVFRAADLRNYYAVKIVIARPGPLPRAALVRYVVRGGVAAGRVQLPLPMSIRIGRFYRIETSAYQDRFVTSIDGRVVDTFFDSRHRGGGVGLFSEPGEDGRVMALRVADRDDFLGRLCAYFLRHSADSSGEATASGSRTDPGGIEGK